MSRGLLIGRSTGFLLLLARFLQLRHNLLDDAARRYAVDCGPGEITWFRPLRRSARGEISRTRKNFGVARSRLRGRDEVPGRSPAIRSAKGHAGAPERHRLLAQLQYCAASFHRLRST